MGEKLLAAVAEGFAKPVERVIDTHWHFDHTGGNGILRGAGAAITAHANVKTRMAAGQVIALIDHEQPPADPGELPTDTLEGDTELDFHGRPVRLLHFPHAHTDGDLAVHLPDADVLHTGDLVFYCGYPFVDVSSGGTIDGVIAAVTALHALCGEHTRVLPGHGPVTDRAGLAVYLDLLTRFRAGVAAEVAKGSDLEAVLASDCTAELDAEYGGRIFPPALFREMVFRTLPTDP
jgi:glyoxylase-like metal-dependent hydrolase (beta-lactamase superfamily II)